MLKKPSHNSDEDKDLAADNPIGTMDRFTEGLKKVLNASKPPTREARKRRKRRRSR